MKNPDIKLIQKEGLPDRKTVDSFSHLLVLHSASLSARSFPYAEKLIARRKTLGKKKSDSTPLQMDLPNKVATHVVYACIKGTEPAFELLTLARKMVAAQLDYSCTKVAVIVAGFLPAESERLAEALIAATTAASAELPSFKSEKSGKKRSAAWSYMA